jgi:hypothetical protein
MKITMLSERQCPLSPRQSTLLEWVTLKCRFANVFSVTLRVPRAKPLALAGSTPSPLGSPPTAGGVGVGMRDTRA